MHIVVTDVLACPRCGPDFGLILLADRLKDRRVLSGRLGCANCREAYPIGGGAADLRYPPGDPLPLPSDDRGNADDEAGYRLAALLGITEGPGLVLVVGAAAEAGEALAAVVPHLEVVTLSLHTRPPEAAPGMSRLIGGERIPARSRAFRGVVLTNPTEPELIHESIRVLGSGGRLVVMDAGPHVTEELRRAGLELLLDEGGIVVASPPSRR